MLNVSRMIKSAEEALGWPYVSPGTSNAQGIDCSGLFVKIYRDQGVSIYHGSNRIFRKYCSETGKLSNTSQLIPGMAVFKWKDRPPDGYSDNMGDFHHIGLVASVKPLRIIHASSAAGKVVTDDEKKLKNWAYWGKLKDVNYGQENQTDGSENMNVLTATVFAESGNSVKMRAKPSTASNTYWNVPIGAVVDVYEKNNDWCNIGYGGRAGYMMTKFLHFSEEENPEKDEFVSVSKAELQKDYDMLGALLKQLFVNKADLEHVYDSVGDMLGLRG